MSVRSGSTRRAAWAFAGILALAYWVSSAPANAGSVHGFFGFNFPFYAQPYPYPPPAYGYPPPYGYPPDYGDEQGYGEQQYSQYQEQPQRRYQDSYCREFQSSIIVNGRPEPAYGIACLQPDGTWRIVR